jgi:hypothetical protein
VAPKAVPQDRHVDRFAKAANGSFASKPSPNRVSVTISMKADLSIGKSRLSGALSPQDGSVHAPRFNIAIG